MVSVFISLVIDSIWMMFNLYHGFGFRSSEVVIFTYNVLSFDCYSKWEGIYWQPESLTTETTNKVFIKTKTKIKVAYMFCSLDRPYIKKISRIGKPSGHWSEADKTELLMFQIFRWMIYQFSNCTEFDKNLGRL